MVNAIVRFSLTERGRGPTMMETVLSNLWALSCLLLLLLLGLEAARMFRLPPRGFMPVVPCCGECRGPLAIRLGLCLLPELPQVMPFQDPMPFCG